MLHSSKKSSNAGRGKETRRDEKPSGDHKTPRLGLSKAHQWPHPLLPPLETPGARRGHMMFLWILSSKIQRHGLQFMWSPGLTVPRHIDIMWTRTHTHTHHKHTWTHTTVSTASWDKPSGHWACSRARGPERHRDYVQGAVRPQAPFPPSPSPWPLVLREVLRSTRGRDWWHSPKRTGTDAW